MEFFHSFGESIVRNCCHPERMRRISSIKQEILHFVQNDKTSTTIQLSLIKFQIELHRSRPTADLLLVPYSAGHEQRFSSRTASLQLS